MPVLLTAPHTLNRGGDAAMKKRKPPLWGNVVKTMKIGNATILICDDCIVKSPEEIEEVLDRFHAAGWAIVEDLIAKGEEV